MICKLLSLSLYIYICIFNIEEKILKNIIPLDNYHHRINLAFLSEYTVCQCINLREETIITFYNRSLIIYPGFSYFGV